MSSLTITTIQTTLFWEDISSNLSMLEKKIDSIPNGTELVILPELFSTGFSMQPHLFAERMNGNTINWMRNIAARKKIILTGSLIIEEEGKFYNRLIWMLPNGQSGHYDKRHLFGFAGEDKHYTPGIKRLIASVKGWKINLQICYDLRFPVWARQQIQDNDHTIETEYDVLVYVANWPERRNHAWKTLLCARAIENQCYVVGVNRVGNDGNNIYHSGDTSIFDPLGETIYQKSHDEDIHTVTLQKESLLDIRKKLPFLKDSDKFGLF